MNSNIVYLSVIIPVFNSELYLDECLQSILNQTFENYEVILIDDGSSDSSSFICDKYVTLDSRFRVIHKINTGAADSRNVGLMEANGVYVIFMDSDDFWKNNNCFEILINEVMSSSECDFIGFNIEYHWNNGHVKKMPSYSDAILEACDKEYLIQTLVETGNFSVSPCSKIIKRKFLIDYNILFPKGIVGEDILWFQVLLEKSSNIRYINEYFYCYRKIKSSVSGNMTLKKYDHFLYVLENSVKYISRANYSDATKTALLSFCAYNFCILSGEVRYLDASSKDMRIKELKKYKWLLKYDLHPKVRKSKTLFCLLGFKMTSYLFYLYISKYLRR